MKNYTKKWVPILNNVKAHLIHTRPQFILKTPNVNANCVSIYIIDFHLEESQHELNIFEKNEKTFNTLLQKGIFSI